MGGVPGAGRQGGVQEEEGDAEMGDSRGSRAEAACEGPRGKDGCPFEFRVVPFWPATAQGVRQAYRDASVEFDRDGLLFLHKGMMYAPGGTPLALLWKDPSCSRFFLETDAEGRVPTHQVVSLRLRMDGTVATGEAATCIGCIICILCLYTFFFLPFIRTNGHTSSTISAG